jgi:hypothetical protein
MRYEKTSSLHLVYQACGVVFGEDEGPGSMRDMVFANLL